VNVQGANVVRPKGPHDPSPGRDGFNVPSPGAMLKMTKSPEGARGGWILPQSLSKVYDAYIGGILRDLDSPCIEINTEPDHAHLLFILSRTHTISDVVGHAKRGSSAWLKTRDPAYSQFHWQNGFGAFSVSQSAVGEVREYVWD